MDKILEIGGEDTIDLLKIDEYTVLKQITDFTKIKFIVGRYYETSEWRNLVSVQFSGWDYSTMHDGEINIFHLDNKMLFNHTSNLALDVLKTIMLKGDSMRGGRFFVQIMCIKPSF